MHAPIVPPPQARKDEKVSTGLFQPADSPHEPSIIRERALIGPVVVGALERGPHTFDELLARCSSLQPDKLQSALDILERQGVIRRVNGEYALGHAHRNARARFQADWAENLDRAHDVLSKIMECIHMPHCLDYEWWFSHTSREELAMRMLCAGELPLPNSLAFLGSPIFGAFASQLLPEQEVFILDKSAATLEAIDATVRSPRLHLVHYDAEQPLPEQYVGIAEMAFFDPPWYVDYYDLFLTRCAQLLYGHFAVIGAVLFPTLTRPNALDERMEILESAKRLGLGLASLQPQAAEYLTPQFERESLIRKGVTAKNWRKGDLAIFLSNGTVAVDNVAVTVELDRWEEVVVGRIKVKVRVLPEEQNDYVAPTLQPGVASGNGQNSTLRARKWA